MHCRQPTCSTPVRKDCVKKKPGSQNTGGGVPSRTQALKNANRAAKSATQPASGLRLGYAAAAHDIGTFPSKKAAIVVAISRDISAAPRMAAERSASEAHTAAKRVLKRFTCWKSAEKRRDGREVIDSLVEGASEQASYAVHALKAIAAVPAMHAPRSRVRCSCSPRT